MKQIKPSLSVISSLYVHCLDMNKLTNELERYQLTRSAPDLIDV